MRITLRQLEVFEQVATTSSYTKAASQLELSQPAVSMQIRQLEEQVELPLFELIGKKVFLTEAGEEFRHYSRAILKLVNEANESMQAMKGLKKGRLKVSVTTTANHFAIELLAEFRRKHPAVQFDLEVTNRKLLINSLSQNDVDVVIMGQTPERADLIITPFLANPLVIVAPNNHPMANRKRITLAELAQETFVAREAESGTRVALDTFFASENQKPFVEHVLNSNESIKKAVAAGLGLGICSIHTIEMELANQSLVILDVIGSPLMRQWNLIHSKGKRLSPIVQAFNAFVLEESKKFSVEQYLHDHLSKHTDA